MEETPYPFELPITETQYNFFSVSQEKKVAKKVVFTSRNYQKICNLALLDVLENGEVSDITETRNNDMRTVLATVIKIIADFLNNNYQNIVVFKGSDIRRHRLYRLIISRELTDIQAKFNIFGIVDGQKPEPFEVDKQYSYFVITKKQ